WDTPPLGTTDNDVHSANVRTSMSWMFHLLPYTKNRQILACPSDPNPKNSRWHLYDANPAMANDTAGTCYDPWGIPTPISIGANENLFAFGGITNPTGTGCLGGDPGWGLPLPTTLAAV